MTDVVCDITAFSISQSLVGHMGMVKKLKSCCVSVGGRTTAHLKSRVLWLVLATGTLLVMFSCVGLVTAVTAHPCCLLGVGDLSSSALIFLLLHVTEKDGLGKFLSTILLSGSVNVRWDSPGAPASRSAGSTPYVFGVFVKGSRLQEVSPNSNNLECSPLFSSEAF